MKSRSEGAARRWQPAGLRDPRFLVGVVLMVVSILGVVGLVNSMDRTLAVYAAAADLGAGERIDATQLKRIDVRLGEASEAYLSADGQLPSDLTVHTAVRAGELIPVRALGQASDDRRPMTLAVAGAQPAGLAVGGLVDVYVSREGTSATESPEPELVARGIEVARILPPQDGWGTQASTEIHVLVGPQDVAALVRARSAGRIDVVAGAAQ